VSAGVPPQSLQKAIRSAIDRVNRNQALGDVRTLEQIVNDSMRGNRVVGTLLGVFSMIALALAALGIYGVISYTTAQRGHELGIRAALGATRTSLIRLIVRGGMRLTVAGLAAGLAAMLPATDVLSSMLYGVAAYDVPTVAGVALLLCGAGGLACFLPAWRITRTDPMEALRDQ